MNFEDSLSALGIERCLANGSGFCMGEETGIVSGSSSPQLSRTLLKGRLQGDIIMRGWWDSNRVDAEKAGGFKGVSSRSLPFVSWRTSYPLLG